MYIRNRYDKNGKEINIENIKKYFNSSVDYQDCLNSLYYDNISTKDD